MKENTVSVVTFVGLDYSHFDVVFPESQRK